MALRYAPKMGTIVLVNFDKGFVPPEMVKRRLAAVVSPAIKERGRLLTVVPLSTTPPSKVMPYHCNISIPFALPPYWGARDRWVKGDMITSVSFDRCDLLILGKSPNGQRIYQIETLSPELLLKIQGCVLAGLGLRS
jgi:mRNA interferase MazF